MMTGTILDFTFDPVTRQGYIKLAGDFTRPVITIGGETLVSDQCSTRAEIEAQVAQIRQDLDQILRSARDKLP